MSNAYLTWAAGLRGIKPGDRSVLMLIADMVRDDGTWQIGIGELADRAEVARNTARAMLDRLAARSLIAFRVERFRGDAQAAHRIMLIRNEEELDRAGAHGFSTRRRALERNAEAEEGGSESDPGVGQKQAEVVGQNMPEGGSAGCPRVGQLSDPLSRPQNSPSKHVPPSDKSSGGHPRAPEPARCAVAAQGELIVGDLAGKPEHGETEQIDPKRAKRSATRLKRPKRVASPWPEGLSFGGVERAYAEENGFHGEAGTRLWARFEAHARSKGSVYVDWCRAWQSWVLNEVKFDAQRRGGGSSNSVAPRPPTAASPNDPIVEFPGGYKRRTSVLRDLVAKAAKNPRKWPPELGAAPGEPGCLVPKHLLVAEEQLSA